MRGTQLRRALLRTRYQLGMAASAIALSAMLSACGGNGNIGNENSELPVKVSGADGASVQLRSMDRRTSSQVTIRVARDGSGAPALPEGLVALGGVYQFTPLGWVEEAIEIRVPFSAAGDVIPHLMIAQPGGEWMEVDAASRDGSFMVARVPQLAYATVVSTSAAAAPSDRARVLSVRTASGVSTTKALTLGFNPQTTAPALPAPNSNGVVTVVSNTTLGLKLQYALPSACTAPPLVSAYAAVWNPTTQKLKTIQLGDRSVASNAGTELYSVPLSASNNGTWVFAALAYCKEPGKLLPRYAVVFAGPVLAVNINGTTTTPPPVIASAPQDVSVVEGANASFSVSAQGDGLAYEWQRSNDGGATFTAIGGATAATYSVLAFVADNAALFRVRVSNANGSTISTAAKLTVTQRVIAPVVLSDPANQTVLEGETASFTVTASGQPAPTIRWQRRAVADANAEAGWTDIVGETGSTYTTAALTSAESASQFRAILRNAGGTASSLPATLVVNVRLIAPTLLTSPVTQSVPAGSFGLFSVTAGGSTPLSYQWFKNAQPIPGANATEVVVLADPVDVGTSYQISVQVSNATGTITSVPVSMNVTVDSTGVTAADGGSVFAADGTSLAIPAGALSSDTNVTVSNAAVDPAQLPAGVIALSEVIDVGPAGLHFNKPAQLSLTVSTEIPAGMTIAILDLAASDSTSSVSAAATKQAQAVKVAPRNLKRTAASGVRHIAAASAGGNITLPSTLNCGNVQSISPDGKFSVGNILGAVRKLAVAVPLSSCSSIAEVATTEIPLDTNQPCTLSSQFAGQLSNASLLNRHVECRSSVVTGVRIEADFEVISFDQNTGARTLALVSDSKSTKGVVTTLLLGTGDLTTELSVSGPSNTLSKTFNIRQRLSNFQPATQDPLDSGPFSVSSITAKPQFGCDPGSTLSITCTYTAPRLTVPVGDWSSFAKFDMQFNWLQDSSNAFDLEFIHVFPQPMFYVVTGADFVRAQGNASFGLETGMSALSTLRCDRLVAQTNSKGCVFSDAAAVYVLDRSDLSVKEAAEHIFEAQNGPLKSPGKFLMKPGTRAIADISVLGGNTLQRLKDKATASLNRGASCSNTTSLIFVRPANLSASCSAGLAPCSCDEYPFASTWNGGYFNPDHTSVKTINANQNNVAGSGNLSNSFYLKERVLDLSTYAAGATPSWGGGDNFWVYVK